MVVVDHERGRSRKRGGEKKNSSGILPSRTFEMKLQEDEVFQTT